MRQVEDAARQARAEPSQLCCTVTGQTRQRGGEEIKRRKLQKSSKMHLDAMSGVVELEKARVQTERDLRVQVEWKFF